MSFLCNQHAPLGATGLVTPPVLFGTAALGNVGRVITEQSKLAICGEWFRQVAPPVYIETSYRHGDGMALEVLGRALRRLDIASDEVVIQLVVDGEQSSAAPVVETWEKSCRLLGDEYRPKMIAVRDVDDDSWRAACELKVEGEVRGCGVVASDWRIAKDRTAAIEPDWITLAGGCSVMRHPLEMLAFMAELTDRQIPVVLSGVFDGGFLLGGNWLDGRAVNTGDLANRSHIAWRKAFVALCDGYGVSPAHACIQFALSMPDVVAVRLESSYADHVAENVNAVIERVPANFWASMKEEGLLAADYPYLMS